MSKKLFILLTIVALVLMAAQCGAQPEPAAQEEAPAEPTAAPVEEAAPAQEESTEAEAMQEADKMTITEADCSYGGLFKSIEAVDDMTVKFTLCTPDVAFPSKVAFTALNIQPSEYLQSTGGTGDILEKPIGTGPYELVDWSRGDSITFKKFDGFFF